MTSYIAYPQIMFEKTYGGDSTEYGFSVVQTNDGGYMIIGTTLSYGAGNEDIYAIKTNEYGDTLWTKTYGGATHDHGRCILKTDDANYLISGKIAGIGAYFLKINDNGDTLWTRTYTNSVDARFTSKTNNSGYITTGQIFHANPQGLHFIFLMKTNLNGNELWYKEYGLYYDLEANYVAQTNDGGYIIAGEKWVTQTWPNQRDIFIIKTDSVGDTIWTKTYGTINHEYCRSLSMTSDGGYLVTGSTHSSGKGSDHIYLLKLNSSGDSLWKKTYNGEDSFCIIATSDGGYAITGWNGDVYLLKLDSVGDSLWAKSFGGISFLDVGSSLAQTNDGGYIIVGYTKSFGAGDADVYLIKTDESGIVGIDNGEQIQPQKFTIYPNPTTGKSTIWTPQQFGQIKSFRIYDCIGQKQIEKTDKFSDIDIGSLTSGLYFIVLTNFNNERLTSKIIKE